MDCGCGGKCLRRTALIGSVEQFPTQELALAIVIKRSLSPFVEHLVHERDCNRTFTNC